MKYRYSRLALASALFAASGMASAIPFASFETRSMAMGGVGVAVGSPDAAPLFNPALLSVSKPEDDFSLILPTVGVQLSDPTKLRDALDTFQSTDTIGTLNTHITDLNNAINTNNQSAASTAASRISSDISSLSSQFTTLSGRPIAVDGGAAAIASIPGKSLGLSFYANAQVTMGGVFNYEDASTLNTWTSNASTCSTDIGNNNLNSTACTALKNTSTTDLKSGVHFQGVALGEMGVAMSHEFEIADSKMALAITPKVVKAQLYDVQLKASDTNQNNVTGADYLAEYSFANFDIGAAKAYDDTGWRTGIVIKNVIPQTLDFKRATTPGTTPVATGSQLQLKPQARFGVSHSTSWSTVGVDLDLTKNDPAGFEQASQYLALGGELDAWGWLQLRAGYRMNLVDSARNIASAGLGFAIMGVVHADVAVAGNSDEVGGSFQLGMHF